MDADVIVVGAGLAGLRCGELLEQAGHEVLVVEAQDDVGGRVRTDVIDGFRCDRGFQVLNPAYPAVRDGVDLAALDLKRFGRGVGVLQDRHRRVVADPLRHPGRLLDTIGSGFLTPRQVLGAARWVLPALASVGRLTDPRTLAATDTGWTTSLDDAGAAGPLRHDVVERFLEGTILEADGSSSATYVRLLVRAFVLATPGVPDSGMAALPRQLAGRLRHPVRTGTPVHAVSSADGGAAVRTDDATLRARQVVVASDPRAAVDLLGLAPVETKGLTTWWFACDERPTGIDMLLLDARTTPGPAVNTAVVSNAAPGYAPHGRHLVQATAVGACRAAADTDVRRQLAEVYACDTRRWDLVVRHEIDHALPAQPAPLDPRREIAVSDSVVVCGDHRDTASIQGALVSGARAARLVAERLHS